MSDIDRELEAAISESEAAAPAAATGGSADPAGPFAGRNDGGEGAEPRRASAQGPFSGGLVSDPPRQEPAQRNVGLLAALLVIGGGILAMVLSSVDEAAVYSVTVDKLVAERGQYQDRSLRVEGELVKGSLQHRAEPCEYRFSIKKGESALPVRYAACVVPDTFRDVPDMDVQVTAEGKLTDEGYFEATHIMAKCPSKYEMQKRKAAGEAAPHGATGAPPDAAPIID